MAYNPISNGRIDADSPITQDLMTDLRDNPEAIALGLQNATRIKGAALSDPVAGDYSISTQITLERTRLASSSWEQAWLDHYEITVAKGGVYRFYVYINPDGTGSQGTRIQVNGVDAISVTSSSATVSDVADVTLAVNDVMTFQGYGNYVQSTLPGGGTTVLARSDHKWDVGVDFDTAILMGGFIAVPILSL